MTLANYLNMNIKKKYIKTLHDSRVGQKSPRVVQKLKIDVENH